MKRLALAAIRFYQRRLSPRNGFCCAYRAHTGRASCSTLGYRAIHRFGVFSGLLLLRRRLGKCAIAHRRYSRISPAWHGHSAEQQASVTAETNFCPPDAARSPGGKRR